MQWRVSIVPSGSSSVSFFAAILIAVVVPVCLVVAGHDWFWLAMGGVAWLIGVALKVPVSVAVAFATRSLGDVARNAFLGAISSVSELGVVVAMLVYGIDRSASIGDLLLFSVAAGATELLVLAVVALVQKVDDDAVKRWHDGARVSALVRHSFFVERMIALGGHTGSRGLVGLTALGGPAWAAAIAVAGFTLTDGLAGYGHARGWDWSDPATFRRLVVVLGAVAAVELAAFALLAG